MRSIVSFLFMFLIVLVIIEKSTKKKPINEQLFANTEFRNISSGENQKIVNSSLPQKNDDLFSRNSKSVEEEIMRELLAENRQDIERENNFSEKKFEKPNSFSNNQVIPVYNPEKDLLDYSEKDKLPQRSSESKSLTHSSVFIYFLKFYGSGEKSHSRLIKVERKINKIEDQVDEVNLILELLKQGPTELEKSKGVLNSIPDSLLLTENYMIRDGILYLSLNSEFEFGAGPEILQDRIDQLAYSLIDNLKLKGIQLSLNGKKVKQLGGTGLAVPSIITKNQRRIITL